MWVPDLTLHRGPKYRAIADAIAADIGSGALASGARLPTHRELAWRLGVTVGTVTRAYAEAERRGLVAGEIGRGTFVSGNSTLSRWTAGPPESGAGNVIDLSFNAAAIGDESRRIGEVLREIAAQPDAGRLMRYQPHAGLPEHRAAASDWLARREVSVSPDHVIVTAGAQNALLATFAALTRPGDTVLAESLTYPGAKAIAATLGLRLEPVAMDAHGVIPGRLADACRLTGARLLYCMPTLQNPTTVTMPEERRAELMAVAARHDLYVVEDDVYGLLPAHSPVPLVNHDRDRGIYVTGVAKILAPGLRVGYIAAPAKLVDRVVAAVQASVWMSPPIMAEIAARWIRDGTGDMLLAERRAAAAERLALARGWLGAENIDAPPGSLHVWLRLPEPWRAGDYQAAAAVRGVRITPAELFAVGRESVPHAVRICLGAAETPAIADAALRRLAEALADTAAPGAAFM